MKKVIGATLVAAAALAGTAALAGENAATEQRAKLNALWGKTATPAVEAQVSSTRGDRTPTFEVQGGSVADRVISNFRSTQPSRAGR